MAEPAIIEGSPLVSATETSRLVSTFLSGRSQRTIDAYQRDLEDFRQYLGAVSVDAAARLLLASAHGTANATALDYRTHLLNRGLQPSTINRRLAALRSLVKLANTIGLVSWSISIPGVKSEKYRDTRGPGVDGFAAILAAARRQKGAKAIRDVAMLRLLHDIGLRRGELVALDAADVELHECRVFVMGKGRNEKQALTLPEPTLAALREWLELRGGEPGPLFVNFDRARKGDGRLTGAAIYALVKRLGDITGHKTRPHGLRHLAITSALDATNGDVRAVQRFSRHRDMRSLSFYDDNRQDLAGNVAGLVAASCV